MVKSHPHNTTAPQTLGVGTTPGNQLITQCGQRGGLGFKDLTRHAHGLANRGEILHYDLHLISSEKEMNRTTSPKAMTCPGGLSTKPSPQTTEVNTPELWLGNRSNPPSALRLTRKNSRR